MNRGQVECMLRMILWCLPLPEKKYLESLVHAVIPSGAIVWYKCSFLYLEDRAS